MSVINFDCNEEQLERSITQLLERKIRQSMTGDEPFDVQHEVFEFETCESPQAQPPQYDIAFFLIDNGRIMWPLEAKVLSSDGRVSEYVKEIVDNFMTCRYAPFSSEGGMLSYLMDGNAENAFTNIEKRLNHKSVTCKLKDHPKILKRDYKTSAHQRKVPTEKLYPVEFCCHHLIFRITGGVDSIKN
ncbi:MAG: hypothetical protein F6K17_39575 [Okeania sp. SIO3C4]|nr:hypothetical protein [Okeania sp. SIO3C4]